MSALETYLEGRDDIPNRDSILFAHRQDMERTVELERDQQKWAANERTDHLVVRIEAAIEASQPDCRWTPDPDGGEVCDEHAELVYGPEGCEDSPRWWKAKAIDAIRAALKESAVSEYVAVGP